MKLSEIIANYIVFKKLLSRRFGTAATCLKAFCRAMGEVDIAEITESHVRPFLNGQGPVTTNWHRKFSILREFYKFAIGRGYVNSCPLPTAIPKHPETMKPYIYSTDDLRRLLAATDKLENCKSPLQAATFRTLLLTLYGTGLRISEALSLTLADVNLSESLLTVRNGKFFKSRIVPTGPKLTQALHLYAAKRRRLHSAKGEDSAFFCSRSGHFLSLKRAEEVFALLRSQAGIQREQTVRYQPRLHDIRHTFAVHRLLNWYRRGADVQQLLPHLSTYLGHIDVASTQIYLDMTPELLDEAVFRFQRYALTEVNHAEQ